MSRIRNPWLPPLSLSPPRKHLKRCSLDALDALQSLSYSSRRFAEIHIDGSGNGAGAWAVSLLWSCDKRVWYFGGFLTGSVTLDSSSAEFVGASTVDSNTAEMSAFSWAFIVALQYTQTLLELHVFFDSMFAAHTADSTWNDGGYGTITKVISSFYNMLNASIVVRLSHEKGHTDLPHNECVDSLCTWHIDMVENGTPPLPLTDRLIANFVSHECEAQWAFIACLPEDQQRQYPFLVEDGRLYLPLQTCSFARWGVKASTIAHKIDNFLRPQIDAAKSPLARPSLPFCILQVNANTLRDNTKFRDYLKQCRNLRVVFICCQEHRRKRSGVRKRKGILLHKRRRMMVVMVDVSWLYRAL